MSDNTRGGSQDAGDPLIATDEVAYSGDTADVQLMRPVHVTGSEGSKSVVDVTTDEGVNAVGIARSVGPTTLDSADEAIEIDTAGMGVVQFWIVASDLIGRFFVEAYDGSAWRIASLFDAYNIVWVTNVTDPPADMQLEGIAGSWQKWRLRINDYTSGSIEVVAAANVGGPNAAPVQAYISDSGAHAAVVGNALKVDGSAVTQPVNDGHPDPQTDALTDAQLRATPVDVDGSGVTQPVSAASLPLPTGAATSALQGGGLPSALASDRLKVDGSGVTQPVSGTVTANAGSNLNTSALATESGGNLAAAATSLGAIDDWDELDRAKVNPIAGQAGVQGGAGSSTALTQRVAIATDANTVATALETPIGATNESAAATDTSTSGLNGLLKRIAQRLTTLIAVFPTTIDTNSGNKSASTLRVILATDQPALTNKLLVTPDSVALPANQSVNQAQVAGTTTDTNSGNKSAGTQRVVLATDQPTMTNAQPVNAAPRTSGGLTIYKNLDIDETGQNVKNAAGQLYGYIVTNAAASARYLKLYNKATAPTVGTDTPVITITLLTGAMANVEFTNGIAFGTGIGVGCTTGVADNNSGAPGANDVQLTLLYA